MRTTDYTNGPYDGVSQAPPQVALRSACTSMVNCLPVIPHGVLPRPPFEYVTELDLGADTPDSHAVLHLIPRGTAADDLLLVVNESASGMIPTLYNADTKAPVAMTVTTEAQAYLDEATRDANVAIRCATIEDVTFVWNRDVTVALSSDTASARDYEALIWVKTGGYARTYRVLVTPDTGTPVEVTYETNTGGQAGHAKGVGTDRIARGLYDGTLPGTGADVTQSTAHLIDLVSQGFTVTLIGSVIYLSHPTIDFTLEVDDDAASTGMVGLKTSVQRFSDLPIQAADGFTIKISQKTIGSASDYYVQFQSTGSENTGVWTEVIEPGAPLGLDPLTMPIGLKLVADVWTLDVLPWRQRITGNLELSPDPDFVGQEIQVITWAKGRLVVVGTGSAYLAASDDPYKFYTTTLASSLDSDPIGLLSAATSKVHFRDAIAFDEDLILFADKSQQRVKTSGEGAATASDTGNRSIGEDAFSDMTRVQPEVKRKAYFMGDRGGYKVLYEMALDRVSGQVGAEDMTSAVPSYIPITVDRAATFKSDFTSIYGTSGERDLYVHTYRYAANERVQNAFHKWQLPVGWTLVDMLFRGSEMTLLAIETSSASVHWLSVDLAPRRLDVAPATLLQFLDLKVDAADCSPVYDPVGDTTTFSLPWSTDLATTTVSFQAGSEAYPEAYTLPVLSQAANDVVVPGDFSTAPLWIGQVYDSSFQPMEWYYRDPDSGTPRHDGRLSLTRLRLDLAKFSHLRAEVSVSGRALRTYTYEGYRLDDPETPSDAPPQQETAVLNVSLGGNSKDVIVTIINDSHLGFQLMGYEWLGDFNIQARRG